MRVNANTHRFEVWLNGQNVSSLCIAADDTEGWVDLIFLTYDRVYVPVDQENDNLESIITRVQGRVRLENVKGW